MPVPFVARPDRFSSDAIIAGRVTDPDGFVTEHRELEGVNGPIKLFFSVAGLRQIADRYPQVGLVRAEVLEQAEEEGDAFKREAEQLRARVFALEAKQERIAGFAADGFKVQKVIGRPKEAH